VYLRIKQSFRRRARDAEAMGREVWMVKFSCKDVGMHENICGAVRMFQSKKIRS